MTDAVSILLFILAVSFLAFIHELGHYLTSKFFKIEVEEFGLGFPPRAKKLFTWKGTDFTLNWIPFGAFVRPKGENDPEVPGGLASAHPLQRLVVLLGGPFMNIVMGVFLFSLIFAQTGIPDPNSVLIGGVVQESPAEKAGLLQDDVVKKANDQVIDGVNKFRQIILGNPGKEVSLDVLRAGQIVTLRVVPNPNPTTGEGLIGVMLTNPVVSVAWYQTVPMAFNVSMEYCRQVLILPYKLIMGQLPPEQSRVTSVVGLGSLFVQARNRDIETQSTSSTTPAVTSLTLVAIISVALGITNLLPIPALDGGRILFLLPELLFRKRVPARYENAVHVIGFFALLLLMAVIVVQDIVYPIVLP
jgi:regulator of sigma E protease